MLGFCSKESTSLLSLHYVDCFLNRLFPCEVGLFSFSSEFVFHYALAGALAHGDPYGDTDQVCVLELDAGTLVSVVPDDLDAPSLKLVVKLL